MVNLFKVVSFETVVRIGYSVDLLAPPAHLERLRLHGDADLPRFADSDHVQLFMTSITKQSWSGLLRKARGRVIIIKRVLADRDALTRFQDSIFF